MARLRASGYSLAHGRRADLAIDIAEVAVTDTAYKRAFDLGREERGDGNNFSDFPQGR